MPISRLLWGSNFGNEIRIGFPLFDLLTDHEERDGSVHDMDGAGAEVAWIEGRDYVIDTEVRWIPDRPGTGPVQSAISGAVAWQGFLDWARGGNAIRFVPDETTPLFYIDNTYLVEPRKGFGNNSSDIKRNVRLKLRNPSIDFHQALRGIMYEWGPGADLGVLGVNVTEVRAQTASYTDAALGVKSVPAHTPRGAYNFLGQRALVVEPSNAKANVILQSEDYTQAIWTNTGPTTLVSADGLISPIMAGDLRLTLVKDTSAGVQQYIHQAIPATPVFTGGGGIKGWGFFAKKGTSAISSYTMFDETSAIHRSSGDITWNADGTVASVTVSNGGTGTATKLGNYHVGGGVYLFLFQTASGLDATHINAVYLYPAGTTAANTGSTYFGGVFVCDGPYPGSYIKTTTTIAPRTGDAFQFNLPQAWPTQEMGIYVKFILHGQLLKGDFTSFLGTQYTSPEAMQWSFNCDNAVPRKFSGSVGTHGGVGFESYVLATTASDGDTIELFLRLVSDGGQSWHSRLSIRVNGGAETFATGSVFILPANFDHPQVVQVGTQDIAGAISLFFLPLLAFKMVAGSSVTTIAQAVAA